MQVHAVPSPTSAARRRVATEQENALQILVVFNLRADVDSAAYEAWARDTDIPTVRALGSISGFDVYRATGLLGSDAPPPYAYAEMIAVGDDDAFGADVASDAMQRVAAEFQAFADTPQFIVLRDITAPRDTDAGDATP